MLETLPGSSEMGLGVFGALFLFELRREVCVT